MWPFRKPEEHRADYTEAAVKAIIEAATGGGKADYRETAAAQAAAGLVGRSLAVATIEGSTPARTGLTPAVLHDLGASLILDGEAVYRIDVDQSGTVTLRRASDWDITGGPDETTWRYRVTLAGPSRNDQVNLPGAGVVHFRFNPSASEPHKGRSPIALAAQSARMAAGLERQLGNEASQPSGQLLPHPEGVGDGVLKEIRADLKRMAGRSMLVPSMAGGWTDGRQNAPADWQARRLGFNPPEAVLGARESVYRGILAAAGIPPALFGEGRTEGKREALRQFLHSTLQPFGDMIAGEATAKLAAPVRFGFDRLFASDIQGRARAFKSLVDGGMDQAEAARVTGMAET